MKGHVWLYQEEEVDAREDWSCVRHVREEGSVGTGDCGLWG